MSIRNLHLRVAILQSLNECGDYLLPEQTLVTQIHLRVKPAPLESEIRAMIRDLDAEASIVAVREHEDYRYGITPKGKADLQRLLS